MVSSLTRQEALARLDPEERGWVEAFAQRVRDEFGPRVRDIRIYGSKVRGDAHDESDIDLLVLVDDGDRVTFDAIANIGYSISSWMSPRVYDFDEYHSPRFRASGFYKELRRESVKL